MKRLGIIQPGKIGDIIICLPIAKWYYDRGYEIIWPIDRRIINNFIGYIEYVSFIPIDFDCRIAHQVCFDEQCNKVIDIAFTIPGANIFNSDWYLNKYNDLSFDQMKYAIAEVPFEEKWNLRIARNTRKEEELFKINTERLFEMSGKRENLCIMQNTSSDTKLHTATEGAQYGILITSRTDSIFDWLILLERAQTHKLIESCFSNLIDQLNIIVPKQVLLLKHGYYGDKLKDGRNRGEPVLRLPWIKI